VTVTPAVREFSYMGVHLPDPNPRLSVDEVKAIYANNYPELATAVINGPEAVGDKLRYEFVKSLGVKG
jgi:PRTRC genetic system protein C